MSYDLSGLKNWYEQFARPFLRRVEPERVAEFDDDLDRLRNASEILDVPSAFCFLGSSGVGKSTLINALVAEGQQVVPSGGVGPLTAQALIIQHSVKPGFRATYHPAKHLNQMAFGLQQSHRHLLAQGDQAPPSDQTVAEGPSGDGIDRGDDDSSDSKATQFRKQAALLIRGKQDADVEVRYLLDGLRSILGQDLIYDSKFLNDDARRIERLRRRLNRDEPGVRLKSEVTLRQEVTSKLGLAIEVQVRSRCESFVNSRQNAGTGVQARILELFEELADEAVEAAVGPAREILLGGYQSVQEEIRQVFDQQRDPLQAASEAIVESEASRLQRSDAEKRKAILDNVAIVLERHRELEDSPIIAERT